MNMRRFTRLTNAFSKKLKNHLVVTALFHMRYNFARIHQTLRVTPAMAAGVRKMPSEIASPVTTAVAAHTPICRADWGSDDCIVPPSY